MLNLNLVLQTLIISDLAVVSNGKGEPQLEYWINKVCSNY